MLTVLAESSSGLPESARGIHGAYYSSMLYDTAGVITGNPLGRVHQYTKRVRPSYCCLRLLPSPYIRVYEESTVPNM